MAKTHPESTETPTPSQTTLAPPGLKGLIVTETEIGDVRGEEGFYHYRQYSAIELARRYSLEAVWYLLFEGHLPSDAELVRFRRELSEVSQPPSALTALLPAIAGLGERSDPLGALRSALSMLAEAEGFTATHDADEATRRREALRLCAVVPSLVTALHRLRRGEAPVAARPDLSYAARYLQMLTGRVPDEAQARAIEQYLICTLDHGFNASTFAARVITATGSDLASAVIGAIGAFAGPLHGGSPARALETLEAIGEASNIDAWARPRIEAGERMMGFGHAVYRTEDPRSRMLREVARDLGSERYALALAVERRVLELLAEYKPGRSLNTNVEFYAGVVMDACGIPPEMFTPTFACSRVIGWCANALEQARDPRIIRPSARYVGPPAPQPLPTATAA